MRSRRVTGCVILLVGLFLAGGTAWANAVQQPDRLIQETTETVLAAIKADKQAFKDDEGKLFAFVGKHVLPHFDFERMSRWVLGKNWRKFNDAQQAQFVSEFRYLLVKTYALALLEYNDQKVVVHPTAADPEGQSTVVKTEIIQSGAPPVAIDYRLYQAKDQHWKVYDITIEGISLVANYRTSFANLVRSNGPDGLLQYLAEKNRG